MDLRYVNEKVEVLLKVPPVVECILNTPRQTNAVTSYTDINNFGDRKIFPVVDDALQVIDDISTNTLQRVQ